MGSIPRRHQPPSGLVSHVSARQLQRRPSPRTGPSGASPSDTCGVTRTAQITGLFDPLAVLGTGGEVDKRSTAGTWQVSKRSAETGAAPAAGNRFLRGPSLHSVGHAWARQAHGLLPGAVTQMKRHGASQAAQGPPQSKAIPRYQQGSRLPADPWATHGPARRTTRDSPGGCSGPILSAICP